MLFSLLRYGRSRCSIVLSVRQSRAIGTTSSARNSPRDPSDSAVGRRCLPPSRHKWKFVLRTRWLLTPTCHSPAAITRSARPSPRAAPLARCSPSPAIWDTDRVRFGYPVASAPSAASIIAPACICSPPPALPGVASNRSGDNTMEFSLAMQSLAGWSTVQCFTPR
jgi:hypothetical protein